MSEKSDIIGEAMAEICDALALCAEHREFIEDVTWVDRVPEVEIGYHEAILPWERILNECQKQLIIVGGLCISSLRSEVTPEVAAVYSIVSVGIKDLNAIRELVRLGYQVQSNTLTATLCERLEVACIVAFSKDAATEFVEAKDHKAANEFWYRYVARGKARKSINGTKVGRQLGDGFFDWLDESRTRLSSAKHPSFLSAFEGAYIEYQNINDPNALTPTRTKSAAFTYRMIIYYTLKMVIVFRDVGLFDRLKANCENQPEWYFDHSEFLIALILNVMRFEGDVAPLNLWMDEA